MVLSGDSDRAGADYVLYLFGVYPRSADIGGHCIYSGCGDWMSVRNAFAGLIFGFGSMYKASALYVMADDRLFSPFQSGAPLESLILSVGTRLLFGVLTGLLFAWSRKRKHAQFFECLTAFIAPKLHAFLVYTAMGIFFPSSGFS